MGLRIRQRIEGHSHLEAVCGSACVLFCAEQLESGKLGSVLTRHHQRLWAPQTESWPRTLEQLLESDSPDTVDRGYWSTPS